MAQKNLHGIKFYSFMVPSRAIKLKSVDFTTKFL